jgi:hypothetical protein
VVETVTGIVIAAEFASVTVTVHAPLSSPGVTVNVTAAPADAGVPLAGLTVATTFPGGVAVGVGAGLGFSVHEIDDANAAELPVSLTVNVPALPPAVSVSELGDATGVGIGVGLGVGVALEAYRAASAGCDGVIGIEPGIDTNVTVSPLTVAGPSAGVIHSVPLKYAR